jgi:hypothetical protein
LIHFFVSKIEEQTKDQQPDLAQNSSIPGMDDEEFRRRGKEMIDYIADYLKHIR